MENRNIKTMLITMLFSLFAVFAVFAIFAVSALPVHAEGEGQPFKTSFSVEISDPKNNIPDDTEFVLKLETDSRAPLPDPAEMTVGKSGSYTFPEIEFTEPGNYSYTIKQIPPEDQNIICDTQVYQVDVTVIRTENNELAGAVTLASDHSSKKPTEISFENDYKKIEGNEQEEEGDTPSTGEALSPAFGGLMLSGVLFAVFAVLRIRQRREQQV